MHPSESIMNLKNFIRKSRPTLVERLSPFYLELYVVYIAPVLPIPPVRMPVASSSLVIRYLEKIP